MAEWRSQMHIEASEYDDAVVASVQSRAFLAGRAVTNMPFDHEISVSSTATDMVMHCRFANEADARAHYASLRGVGMRGGASVGTMRFGDGFRNSGQIHGKVSVHLCTHGDAVVLPCNESEYSETVF